MGVFSRFINEISEDKRSFNMFIRMFGQISNQLGINESGADSGIIEAILENMEIEDSTNVFILMVLMIHSYPKSSPGILILKQMGMRSVNGENINDVMDSLSYNNVSSVSELVSRMIPVLHLLQNSLENTSEEMWKEPIRLFLGFQNHLEYIKHDILSKKDKQKPSNIAEILKDLRLQEPLDIRSS